MESEKDDAVRPQTPSKDVVIEHGNSRIEIDLHWIEWFIVGLTISGILFTLDLLGYW